MRLGGNQLEGGVRLIQVYTGNGKGKTTAALGLAIRAAGAGLSVYIGQFAKGRYYSELSIIKKIRGIKVEQFGRRCFIKGRPQRQDIELALNGLKKSAEAIMGEKYRMIVLDEINIAIKLNLIRLGDVLAVLKACPKHKEIIITGRYAPLEILKAAHLVSEVRDKKHYYRKGVKARRGIEF